MRRLVPILVLVLIAACSPAPDSASTDSSSALSTLPAATSSVAPSTTSTTSEGTTTTTPTTSTSLPVRFPLEELGVAPAVAIDQPANFVTLPPPFDGVAYAALGQFPYESVRIASRYEINEDAFDEPIGGDSGYTIIPYARV